MYHIIANPSSRSGKAGKLWVKVVRPYLNEHHLEYRAWLSQKNGDIEKIIKKIEDEEVERPLRLVVLGGDGTVNELLQGLKHPEDVILSFLPVGSGNDLGRAIGIPSNIQEAMKIAFETGSPRKMDLGELTFPDGSSRKFIISCGIGFDAAVCESVNKSTLKVKLNRIGMGKLSYLGIAIREIVGARRVSGSLQIDGKPAMPLDRLLFVTGMNEAYEGGGFKFCPKADDSDGKLSLCIVQEIPVRKFFLVLPFAMGGKHAMFRGISLEQGASFTIKLEEPLWVHTDGEVSRMSDAFTARAIPGAITFVKP